MKILAIALATYFILLSSITVSIIRNNIKYSIKYTGIVWVVLDHYTIWKYNSNDTPMKIITYTKERQ